VAFEGDFVRLTKRSIRAAGLTGVAAILACLIPPTVPTAAAPDGTPHCANGRAALRSMLESEYAFGEKARSSVRGAFLEYLADDAVVLNPDPEQGRAVYLAAKESKNQLEWYPRLADVASSGDLGFTEGPYTFTLVESGKQYHGHFLTVWKRDASCAWRVEFDGGVSHPAPSISESKLVPNLAPLNKTAPPPAALVTADAASRGIAEFQRTVQQDGFAAALRTYGRDFDFLFMTDEQSPVGIGEATTYLAARAMAGAWKEVVRGQSEDSSIAYSVGQLTDGSNLGTHTYVQIWQFDPKVANWGLRVLLINPLPPPKAK
jgi:ketosteroid isomerase-like protein